MRHVTFGENWLAYAPGRFYVPGYGGPKTNSTAPYSIVTAPSLRVGHQWWTVRDFGGNKLYEGAQEAQARNALRQYQQTLRTCISRDENGRPAPYSIDAPLLEAETSHLLNRFVHLATNDFRVEVGPDGGISILQGYDGRGSDTALVFCSFDGAVISPYATLETSDPHNRTIANVLWHRILPTPWSPILLRAEGKQSTGSERSEPSAEANSFVFALVVAIMGPGEVIVSRDRRGLHRIEWDGHHIIADKR
jgi:hypothetical protein